MHTAVLLHHDKLGFVLNSRDRKKIERLIKMAVAAAIMI